MKYVWILEESIDWEGSDTIAIFTNKRKAKKFFLDKVIGNYTIDRIIDRRYETIYFFNEVKSISYNIKRVKLDPKKW